jgi:hypothetical protein
VWAALNLAGLLAYLRFFARRATGEPLRGRLLALSMLAWPVFLNIFSGQINVVLAICAAEFLRAAVGGKPFVAGLWLGGLLLKPQFLVLLLLALLLQRSLRALVGFLTASIVVLGVSAFLLGAHGISELAKLWTLYAKGQQETLAVGVMMNWRMVGLHLASLAGPWLGSAVIIAGTGLTVLAFLVIWMRPVATKSPAFVIAILGTLAATALVAWHSHYTSAIMMLGPFIFLSQPHDRLPKNAFAVWCLLPAGLYLAALVFGPLLSTLLPSLASQVPSFLFSGIFLGALGMFGLNIYFLAWAVMKTRQPAQLETQPSIP